MAVFEIQDDNDCIHRIVHRQTPSPKIRKLQAKGFLVKGGGRGGGVDEELLAVFVPPNKKKINVLRWNDSEYEWEKLDGLGNKALFVSSGGSFLEKQVTARGMESKIFLPFFHGVNGIVYSLSANKYHSFFDASFSSAGPNQLEQPQHSAWIEPNWTQCDPDFNW